LQRFCFNLQKHEVIQLPLSSASAQARIWQAIGTEADASWAIDGTVQEVTYCWFNAVLRDYARLGRLLAYDGAWEGRQLIPRQWLLDATTVPPGNPILLRQRPLRISDMDIRCGCSPASSADLPCSESGPNHFCRSSLEARHGADSCAQETLGAILLCRDHHPVAQRGRAAWKMIIDRARHQFQP
jgi:hypothetical protein